MYSLDVVCGFLYYESSLDQEHQASGYICFLGHDDTVEVWWVADLDGEKNRIISQVNIREPSRRDFKVIPKTARVTCGLDNGWSGLTLY